MKCSPERREAILAKLEQHACGDLCAALGGRVELLDLAAGGHDADDGAQQEVLGTVE